MPQWWTGAESEVPKEVNLAAEACHFGAYTCCSSPCCLCWCGKNPLQVLLLSCAAAHAGTQAHAAQIPVSAQACLPLHCFPMRRWQ